MKMPGYASHSLSLSLSLSLCGVWLAGLFESLSHISEFRGHSSCYWQCCTNASLLLDVTSSVCHNIAPRTLAPSLLVRITIVSHRTRVKSYEVALNGQTAIQDGRRSCPSHENSPLYKAEEQGFIWNAACLFKCKKYSLPTQALLALLFPQQLSAPPLLTVSTKRIRGRRQLSLHMDRFTQSLLDSENRQAQSVHCLTKSCHATHA